MVDGVWINGIYYYVKETAGHFSGDTLGEFHPTQSAILIDQSLEDQIKKSTLVHEIVEAWNWRYEWKLPHEIITQMEAAVYQLVIENPELIEYLLNDEEEDEDAE